METEVRYHMLRPDQVVARRQACPVAYIPIGTLEWHGVHNPLGADTLQAEGLADAVELRAAALASAAGVGQAALRHAQEGVSRR